MFIHRFFYLIKKSKRTKWLLWVMLVLIFLLIISLGLFWLDYAGLDEAIDAKYKSLRFVNRLPKLLDIYYLPLMFKKSDLPQYELIVDKEDLNQLYKNIPGDHCYNCLTGKADEYIPARFIYLDKEYKVKIKVRGDVWNHWIYPKKSWRIKFDKDNLFNGIRDFDLILPSDREFVAEYLNYYRSKKLDLSMPQLSFVTLKINNKYYGVYLKNERLGSAFLEKNKHSADVNLYGDKQIADNLFFDPTLWKKYSQDQINKIDNYAELIQLLNLIKHASDQEFYNKVAELVDMDNLYAWNIISLLAGIYHHDFAHNMKMYFDLTQGKFKFVPQDVGLSDMAPADVIYNPLMTRVIKHPQFIHRRNQILWEYVKDDKNLNDDLREYDEIYNQTRGAVYRDRKNNYSNFYFDKKVKIRKQKFEDLYLQAQELLKQGRAAGIVDLSANLVSDIDELNNLSSLDFLIDNFSGASLDKIEISLEDEIDSIPNNLVLYYDANKNKVLDNPDIRLDKFELVDDKLTVNNINHLMLAERNVPEYIDYKAVDMEAGLGPLFKPVRIKITRHHFFIASSQKLKASDTFNKFQCVIRNAISGRKMDYQLVYTDNTTFQYFDDIILEPQEFIKKYPEFKLQDNSLVLGPGNFEFKKTVIIPRKASQLIILPGTTIKLAPQVSIFSYAPLKAQGFVGQPIIVERLDKNQPWGAVAVIDQADRLSQVEYVRIIGGSDAYVNGIFASGQLSFYWSDVDITNCEFRNAQGDDGLNIKYAKTKILNNHFINNAFDALDLDFADPASLIAGNKLIGNGNDGIDISGSAILIKNNQVLGSGDKCISLGEHSNAIIFNNLLINCQMGIAVKDLSEPIIINNTIIKNQQGIAIYQKKPIFGGGKTWVYNSILWDNKENFYLDDKSEVEVSYSNIQDGFKGENNISLQPKFDKDYYSQVGKGSVKELKEYLDIELDNINMGNLE